MALFHKTHENIPNFSKFSKPPAIHLIKASRFIKNFLLSFQMKKPSQEVDGPKKC